MHQAGFINDCQCTNLFICYEISKGFMICTILIQMHVQKSQCTKDKSCLKLITRTIEECDLKWVCILIFVIVIKPLKKVTRKYLNKR